MFDGVQLFPIEVELEKTAFQYSNTGSFTQVQFFRTAILAALLRYSFPVQQSWQLYSGTVFQNSNPGSFTQVQLSSTDPGSFTKVQQYCTAILAA
jgi:hypothetical protein